MLNFKTIFKNYVDNPTLIKAKRIYANDCVRFIEEADKIYTFGVQSESNKREFYDVELDFSEDEHDPDTDCTCPQSYNTDFCKHVAACLLYLDENADNEQFKDQAVTPIETDSPSYPQVYFKPYLYEWEIFKGINSTKEAAIRSYIRTGNVQILNEFKNKSVKILVGEKRKAETVDLKRIGQYIYGNCSCGEKNTLCSHTRTAMYFLLTTKKDPNYLDTLRDLDIEKAKLLAKYNLKLEDEEAKYFDFKFAGSELKIIPKDNIVLDLPNWDMGKTLQDTILLKKKKEFKIPVQQPDNYIFILKLNDETPIIRWEVHPVFGDLEKIEKIGAKILTSSLRELEKVIPKEAQLIYNFTPNGIIDNLRYHNLLSPHYKNPSYELKFENTEMKHFYNKNFMVKTLKNYVDLLAESQQFYLPKKDGNNKKVLDLEKLTFSRDFFHIHLVVEPSEKFIRIKPFIKIKEDQFEIKDFQNCANVLLIKNNIGYIVDSEINWKLLQDFEQKKEMIVFKSEEKKLYKEYLLPLRNQISIDMPEEEKPATLKAENTTLAVRLKEMEPNYLLFQPIIKYGEIEAEIDDQDVEIYIDGKLQLIGRELDKEQFLVETIQNLHPKFADQSNLQFYYLPFSKALEKGWFFEALKKLAESNIEIYGQKQLTKFKYNTNKAKIDIKGGSGIDWFDLKIEISYGDQLVPIKALKQAILNKQDFIQLGDGTLGLLPEEWLVKFRSLFQLGNLKNDDNLQVSKLHYTLIDELHNNISDQSILQELALKKQQLNQLADIKELKMPKNIKATLRPYQLAGLNWFNQLHKIGWGGCLADDMGLGKTLQTLCYLQELHNNDKSLKVLIVCPTSLIYNWQAEIDKFTKGLKYVIYHGTEREFPKEKEKWNILITSYGTMRNDIEQFGKINFDVTILDESQSIKNPTSQVTKAVALINTKMRFILSGTPVQNNTFDLYAQLNFVNPGLLGNQEFFKAEFATAIDKFGDKEKSQQLRRMVYPFVLRRTKEQVAPDLPDKTETIMYCEMGKYQQKVYDAVKEEFRVKILESIEEKGVSKSAFIILEGLNKLRQICDCPSLLTDADKNRFKQESIKLDELMREIEENISNHKMLVFSQFLGMLALVREKLDADGIKYIYLDGSTPAKERAKLVDSFQNDSTIQVFLISLKAGGVGLNLTAADYVYVMDPWWNPAVEDQAIDRTHRIGQTKKIFAYKLICKNSIEEKIIQLQEKKKSLAKELITEDASFVKKLTKDDVAWLLN